VQMVAMYVDVCSSEEFKVLRAVVSSVLKNGRYGSSYWDNGLNGECIWQRSGIWSNGQYGN